VVLEVEQELVVRADAASSLGSTDDHGARVPDEPLKGVALLESVRWCAYALGLLRGPEPGTDQSNLKPVATR
jgi:hypothetical protein